MYILDVIPAVKIPNLETHLLSYFSPEALPAGAVVRISLGRRQAVAIVMHSREAGASKMQIKKSSFQIKSIANILSAEPIFNDVQLRLLAWCAEYYFSPLPLFVKTMLPSYLAQRKGTVSLQYAPRYHKKNGSSLKPTLCALRDRHAEYKDALAACVAHGRQALILVPEIARAHMLKGALSAYEPVILTGEMTPKSFFSVWNAVRTGAVRVVIGTRAAVFSNFFDLGLVIVDEEHSPHFKSWDMAPYYHTVTVALKLAELSKARLILGSAAPSVSSYWRAKNGIYALPFSPEKNQNLPLIQMVDMRNELLDRNYSAFSYQLKNAIEKIIHSSSQKAILFVSRRGYESFSFCRDCGRTEQCPDCAAHLVYHASPTEALICHHCGFTKAPSLVCPYCQSPRVKTFGAGTQKAAEEIKKLFGYADVAVLDSDTATSAAAAKRIIGGFATGASRILIATQAALNKPDIPKADLIGVVSWDNALHLPDYKIQERLYHIVHDLLAYARKDTVFLFQTFFPEHEIFFSTLTQDYEQFFEKELIERRGAHTPPFSHLVKLVFRDISESQAERKAESAARILEKAISDTGAAIELEGPAPAYVRKIKNQYTRHVVLKVGEEVSAQKRNELLRMVAKDVVVDVDPEHLI